MAEYIPREAAIDRLNENWKRTNEGSIAQACYSAAIDSIMRIPAADVVEVRHGRWIDEPGHIPHCSVCGRYSDDADTGDAIYCPFCGAKMDGGQDDV